MGRASTATRAPRFSFATRTLGFDSGGDRCRGDLYLPDRPSTPPVVVMGPDFAAERTFGYPRYAERFAAAGYAVFRFDYRGFGDSEGTPRHLVDPERQVADWHAAIARVRRVDDVDGRRVVPWGFSLSGGHALRVASEARHVAAAVALAPVLDGRALARSRSTRYLARALRAGVRDRLGAVVGRPATVPVVGGPGEFAAIPRSPEGEAYLRLVPRDSDWRNATPARSLLAVSRYRPVTRAADVTCPSLFLAGDDARTWSGVTTAADRMDDETLVRLPVGRFDLFGDAFEASVAHQLAFLDSAVSG
jgi:dienelactone hydrolase